MRDTYHHFVAVPALASASQADERAGAIIDLAGYESVLFVVNTGTVTGSGDFGFKIQESDTPDAGAFTDAKPEDVLGTAPATLEANKAYRLGYVTSSMKRYVRLALTKAGGTSIQAGAVALLGHGERTVR